MTLWLFQNYIGHQFSYQNLAPIFIALTSIASFHISIRATGVEQTPGEFLVILQILNTLQLTSKRNLRNYKSNQSRAAPGETLVYKQTPECIYNSPPEETSENRMRLLEGNLHYIYNSPSYRMSQQLKTGMQRQLLFNQLQSHSGTLPLVYQK